MCVGEKRRAYIPPGLAYGMKGDGKNIPGLSPIIHPLFVLKFVGGVSLSIDIELLDHEHREYDEKWKKRLERLADGETDEDIKNFPDGDPEEQRERERERDRENERKKSGKKESKEDKERRLEHRKERMRHRHVPHREAKDEERINKEWEDFVQFKIEKREGREYKESHAIPKTMKKTEEELEKEEETKKRIEKKKKKKKSKGFPKNIEEMGELQPDGSRLVNYSYTGGQDDEDMDDED
ncbi:hypothetical protein FACS189472_12850 [Alphaproteobacteria bacterium]|nr:hypothetical protein FACS189472_12850 [Alphaproteobacteria bacterium]